MSGELTPVRIADDAFEFKVHSPAEAHALARKLRTANIAEDVVAGLGSVVVLFDPRFIDEVKGWLGQIRASEPPIVSDAPTIEIGIAYGGEHGPDFERVCQAMALTPEAFIAAHISQIHTVEMIGFTPGFSYISGLTDAFQIPRLSTPRPRVAAGSVGISAAFTGIYALKGPGGWPLIGRTDAVLFDPDRDEPFYLKPGQRLKFKAV